MPEHYLGIDVGWSRRHATTGLCLITLDPDGFQWECRNSTTSEDERKDDLRSLIHNGTALTGVGIDGQLAGGLVAVDHYRAAEALLNDDANGVFEGRCNPWGTDDNQKGQPLHHHATELANLVLELKRNEHLNIDCANHLDQIHKYRIVEAHPTAFLAFLLADCDYPVERRWNQPRSDAYWEIVVQKGYLQDLIQQLAPECPLDGLDERLSQIRNHDRRDAFVCALTAMCVSKQQYVAVGDPRYGDIVLTPFESWGRGPDGEPTWAEIPLREAVIAVLVNGDNNPNHSDARVICNGCQWIPEVPTAP